MILDILQAAMAFLATVLGLILVHEGGHYLAGRWLGVHAERFSLGFGRALLAQTDRRGTEWRLSAIPLGGYVAFRQTGARSFEGAGPWRRALIAAAGPAFNVVAALLIVAGVMLVAGRTIQPARIAELVAGSPAERAGLLAGDRITAINGRPVERHGDIGFLISRHRGDALRVSIERDGPKLETLEVSVKPDTVAFVDRWGARRERPMIGIRSVPGWTEPVGVLEALPAAVAEIAWTSARIVEVLSGILLEARIQDVAGPGQMAMAAGDAFSVSWKQALLFAAAISLNLALFNLLPLPGLDGWHVLCGVLGGLTGRQLSPSTRKVVTALGAVAVLALMLMGAANDLLLFV